MREDRERLLDIQEAIARIEKYAAQGRDGFERDELVQNWITRHLQIIGEAARCLSDGFRARHPDVPWSQIVGMRHILVHNYFEIDTALVWSVVERHLADLKAHVEEFLREAGPDVPPAK